MLCPHANLEIHQACWHRQCWLFNQKAKCNCVAIDTGTTRINASDLARINQAPVEKYQKSIKRGQEKLSAWLKLIRDVEDVAVPAQACSKCGRDTCKGGSECFQQSKELQSLENMIPLAKAVEMNPAKWIALLKNGALQAYQERITA